MALIRLFREQRLTILLVTLFPLLIIVGCVEEQDEEPKERAARSIINEWTTEVRDFEAEMATGKAVIDATPTDPGGGSAMPNEIYKSATADLTFMTIQQNLKIYELTNGSLPESVQEFRDFLQQNGTALPQVQGDRAYAYDVANHRLVILRYPEITEQIRKEIRGQ